MGPHMSISSIGTAPLLDPGLILGANPPPCLGFILGTDRDLVAMADGPGCDPAQGAVIPVDMFPLTGGGHMTDRVLGIVDPPETDTTHDLTILFPSPVGADRDIAK